MAAGTVGPAARIPDRGSSLRVPGVSPTCFAGRRPVQLARIGYVSTEIPKCVRRCPPCGEIVRSAVQLDDNDAALRDRVAELRAWSTACSECGLPVTRLIKRIHDPVDRSRAATDAITTILAEVGLIAGFRRAAVHELRGEMTQREVADVLGISQARVAQIEHAGDAPTGH